ncbi:MAG: TolC family protein [Candidatus Glassbacteria bacterium]|nr:TolC family protein [Candidatus Glassbacteria bacterium]
MRKHDKTGFWKKSAVFVWLMAVSLQVSGEKPLFAREQVLLTLDSAVNIAMGRSYRIKQLELGIERTRFWLKSRQASLKSRIFMELKAPDIEAVSETKWNSTLKKDEIIHSNTRLWQMDLSVKQPVLVFGYPTNGYLSLNNQIYRYSQEDGGQEVDYYNRFFLKFEQPFLLPNNLKNDIEDAELDLQKSELEYIADRVSLIDRVSDDYYDLFEVSYKKTIFDLQIENLRKIAEIAQVKAGQDTARVIETVQVQVELANARESLLRNQSEIRREIAAIKQRLQLSHEDSVFIEPVVKVVPIKIDVNQAIQYGNSLHPRLRILEIDKRKGEIDVNNSTGWDAFHLNLEMTYGMEKQKDQFREIWDDYDGSYSVSINAYVPIWDWGRRKARIEAEKISLKKTELYIEETQNRIRSDIVNAVDNLRDYQQRALNMQSNIGRVQDITDFGMNQYRDNLISLQDLLQMVARQKETELNFLDAYLGYRRSLLSLMIQTYYDYENGESLIDKFRVES